MIKELKTEEWDKQKVLEIFKELNFKRYIDRFNLLQDGIGQTSENEHENLEKGYTISQKNINEIKDIIKEQKEMIFYINTSKDENPEKIIKEKIVGIGIFNSKSNEAYYLNFEDNKELQDLKEIFENKEISKIGIDLGRIYILLKQENINLKGTKEE